MVSGEIIIIIIKVEDEPEVTEKDTMERKDFLS